MITKIITTKDGECAVSEDGHVRPVVTAYGLSADEKPIEDMKNADRFLEMDSGEMFLFDEQNQKWLPA